MCRVFDLCPGPWSLSFFATGIYDLYVLSTERFGHKHTQDIVAHTSVLDQKCADNRGVYSI